MLSLHSWAFFLVWSNGDSKGSAFSDKWDKSRDCTFWQACQISSIKLWFKVCYYWILRKFIFSSLIKILSPYSEFRKQKRQCIPSRSCICVFYPYSLRKNLILKRGTTSSNSFISLWKTEVLSCTYNKNLY